MVSTLNLGYTSEGASKLRCSNIVLASGWIWTADDERPQALAKRHTSGTERQWRKSNHRSPFLKARKIV